MKKKSQKPQQTKLSDLITPADSELATRQEFVQKLLQDAVDLTENKWTYTNQVQLSVSANEIVLDYYFLAPNTLTPGKPPTAYKVQRLVLPISIAKEASQLILQAIERWENVFGISLPLDIESFDRLADSEAEKT